MSECPYTIGEIVVHALSNAELMIIDARKPANSCWCFDVRSMSMSIYTIYEFELKKLPIVPAPIIHVSPEIKRKHK